MMENFQLYRTNLYLGGQMKWDIVLDHSNNGLAITNFNLSPISNNIPFNKKVNNDLLRNYHKDNVKHYYKSIEGYFYNDGLDSEFKNEYPIITKLGEKPNIYSNIYDMGCKRSKCYKAYNKQFEFFCPVWIEKIEDTIEFEFKIKSGAKDETCFATKKLSFKKLNNTAFNRQHNLFVDYFKQYVVESGLNTGSDNVINIQVDKLQAVISGLNAKNGMIITKDASNIVNNFISRERPIMEFDDILMSAFYNNSIICNQLFNFNFCFNLDDMLSGTIAKMIYGKDIVISVNVYIDGKKLQLRDFDSNYETILKDQYYTEFVDKELGDIKLNALDHLHDNFNINLINKNKYCQKICHWSLSDDSNYMFNMYEGLAGYCIIGKEIIENSHQYGSTPNTKIKLHDYKLNNAGWINIVNANSYNELDIILRDMKSKELATKFFNSNYINGLKYKKSSTDEFYVLGICTDYSNVAIFSNDTNREKYCIDDINNCYVTICNKNLIVFISASMDAFTFATTLDNLSKLDDIQSEAYTAEIDKYLRKLYNIMSSKEDPKLIMLNGLLDWEYCKGPSADIKEIEYFKNNNSYNFIFRYDGKLKPKFIDKDQILYYKDFVSDNRDNGLSKLQKSSYCKYINTEFAPLYPSIEYCAVKHCKCDYDNPPMIKTTEYDNMNLVNAFEYSWFNNGKSIFLKKEIEFTYNNCIQENNKYKSLDDIVLEFISEYYHVKDNEKAKYIASKYEVINNWEYLAIDNVKDYVYTIKLILK